MLIIVMALDDRQSADRTRNGTDATLRSKVTADLETKDQGSSCRHGNLDHMRQLGNKTTPSLMH